MDKRRGDGKVQSRGSVGKALVLTVYIKQKNM